MNIPLNRPVQLTDEVAAESGQPEMLVILNRKVGVKLYPVVARITLLQERPELVSLLNKVSENSGQNLPSRLEKYLEREQLWNNDLRSLTTKGKSVSESGCYTFTERGLYRIWYSDNDPLLGTRPLMIQRDTAWFEPQDAKVWKSGVDAKNSPFRTSGEFMVNFIEEKYQGHKTELSECNLSVKSIEPDVICSAERDESIDLEWKLGLSMSEVTLKGMLEVANFTSSKTGGVLPYRPVPLDISTYEYPEKIPAVMSALADQMQGGWQHNTGKFVFSLDKVRGYKNAVEQLHIEDVVFQDRVSISDIGDFESVSARCLPIKPTDRDDALKWQQSWLDAFHSRQFIAASEASRAQSKWLDHDSLKEFDLALKTDQDLLDSFQKENQNEAYWRVAAITDLSVGGKNKSFLPFTLMNNDPLDLSQLIVRLSGADRIKSVIYSDRYVRTQRQGIVLSHFASLLSEVRGVLLTLTDEADLPAMWKREIFAKESDNHGRYWVLEGVNQIYCWECSNSLDFVRDNGGSFSVDGTPTFTPKEIKELPRYLADRVRRVASGEY